MGVDENLITERIDRERARAGLEAETRIRAELFEMGYSADEIASLQGVCGYTVRKSLVSIRLLELFTV